MSARAFEGAVRYTSSERSRARVQSLLQPASASAASSSAGPFLQKIVSVIGNV
jgi:hypothetical protein